MFYDALDRKWKVVFLDTEHLRTVRKEQTNIHSNGLIVSSDMQTWTGDYTLTVLSDDSSVVELKIDVKTSEDMDEKGFMWEGVIIIIGVVILIVLIFVLFSSLGKENEQKKSAQRSSQYPQTLSPVTAQSVSHSAEDHLQREIQFLDEEQKLLFVAREKSQLAKQESESYTTEAESSQEPISTGGSFSNRYSNSKTSRLWGAPAPENRL
jgi:hypothetical protein